MPQLWVCSCSFDDAMVLRCLLMAPREIFTLRYAVVVYGEGDRMLRMAALRRLLMSGRWMAAKLRSGLERIYWPAGVSERY